MYQDLCPETIWGDQNNHIGIDGSSKKDVVDLVDLVIYWSADFTESYVTITRRLNSSKIDNWKWVRPLGTIHILHKHIFRNFESPYAPT